MLVLHNCRSGLSPFGTGSPAETVLDMGPDTMWLAAQDGSAPLRIPLVLVTGRVRGGWLVCVLFVGLLDRIMVLVLLTPS